MIMRYETCGSAETFELGRELSSGLKTGDVVALYGDLGAGKTVFVKGVAEGLGVRELVTSPTFNIVREYEGDLKLYHFDVYRISSSDEMDEIGYYDCLNDGVCLIEWADRIGDILPAERIDVTIEHKGDDIRSITVTRPDEKQA